MTWVVEGLDDGFVAASPGFEFLLNIRGEGIGVGDGSWMKSQRSISSIFSLVLTSKTSSITFVIVQGP